MKQSFTVTKKCALIAALSENVGGVRLPALKSLLKAGEVRVNGEKQHSNCQLCAGDCIAVFVPSKFLGRVPRVLFADDNIVIVDKPPFFDVENNLLSWLLLDYPTAKAVHRLDRNTSGLVMFSLNNRAYEAALKGFKNQGIEKMYLAEVEGCFAEFGLHSAYLTKDSERAEVEISATFTKGSKKIVTEFLPYPKNEPNYFFPNHAQCFSPQSSPSLAPQPTSSLAALSTPSLVPQSVSVSLETTRIKVRLVTGRTHQIRAHLAFLGHPVLGDGRYGSSSGRGYALVSYQITFAGLSQPLDYLNGKTFTLE